MSKAYQDKATLKWKWGTRGQPIYNSKQQCEAAGLKTLTDKLLRIRDRIRKDGK